MLGQIAMLARKHPGLAMLMGRSYASELPAVGSVTYELRDYDATTSRDKAVIGRVTVTAGHPAVLPSPGAPFPVKPMPDKKPTTHLTARLRWSTPDTLRQMAILQFGYNVYRLPKSYTDQHAFPLINPSLAALKAAVSAQSPFGAINHLPVVPEDDLDDTITTNDDDRQTVLFIDDNDGLMPGGTPLHNGDEFYYFVCARDVLGRDGEPSNGTYVKICDWMPPLPPGRVKAEPEYDYTGNAQPPGRQRFRVSWFDAGVSWGDNNLGVTAAAREHAAGFYIYRWASIKAISSFGGLLDPETGAVAGNVPIDQAFFVGSVERENNAWIFRPAGGVPVAGNVTVNDLLGLERFSIVDVKGPHTPDNAATSYVYTVRAYDDGACGRNVSGDSGPAMGNLLDVTSSTDQAIGTLTTKRLASNLVDAGSIVVGDAPDWRLWAQFAVRTANPGAAAWVEFEWPAGTLLGRVPFHISAANGIDEATLNRIFDNAPAGKPRCRVRLQNGTNTAWVEHIALIKNIKPTDPSVKNQRKAAEWTLSTATEETIWVTGMPGPVIADPGPPDGPVEGPKGTIDPPANAKRWRVYRSANFGPKVQIAHGTGDAPADWADKQPPVHGGWACYYSQVDMGHGKVGPMTPLGECVFMQPAATQMPTPTLTKLERAAMLDGSPGMRVRWECPPHGFERFEVLIIKGGSVPPTDAGNDLSDELSGPYDDAVLDTNGGWPPLGVYQTVRVTAIAGFPRNDFSALVPVEAGATYFVAVRCVGPGPFRADDAQHPARVQGQQSEMKEFAWVDQTAVANQPAPANGTLPWPARGLPRTLPNYGGMSMALLHDHTGGPDTRFGPLLRIGNVTDVSPVTADDAIINTPSGGVYSRIPASLDPHASVFQVWERGEIRHLKISDNPERYRDEGVSFYRQLFPCVLYRRQIDSDRFPVPIGSHRDWVQVTPMIEQIAYERRAAETLIHDPWIVFTGTNTAGTSLWIVDRHPVVKGMAYEYALMLFDQKTKEMHSIMNVGTVLVQ